MAAVHSDIEGKEKDMIKFSFKATPTGVPIIKDTMIDSCGEQIIREFCPELLENPGQVPIEEIAESYFHLSLDYADLSQDGHIWGSVVFFDTDGKIVYSPEDEEAKEIAAKRGTIFIDNGLTWDERIRQRYSTTAHECGHWLFHQLYWRRRAAESDKGAAVCDRDADISQNGRRALVTDKDWMEHQAGYFSGAILMPKTAFLLAAQDKGLRDAIDFKLKTAPEDERNWDLAWQMSRLFNVSREAAYVRIQELGCSMGPGMSFEELRRKRMEYLQLQKEMRDKKDARRNKPRVI